eukprot:Polyplicarium_translucidae@DN1951_c0_g1_i3.p3
MTLYHTATFQITLISKGAKELGDIVPDPLTGNCCLIEITPCGTPSSPSLQEADLASEKERLLVIFDDAISRERFYTCMKILRCVKTKQSRPMPCHHRMSVDIGKMQKAADQKSRPDDKG